MAVRPVADTSNVCTPWVDDPQRVVPHALQQLSSSIDYDPVLPPPKGALIEIQDEADKQFYQARVLRSDAQTSRFVMSFEGDGEEYTIRTARAIYRVLDVPCWKTELAPWDAVAHLTVNKLLQQLRKVGVLVGREVSKAGGGLQLLWERLQASTMPFSTTDSFLPSLPLPVYVFVGRYAAVVTSCPPVMSSSTSSLIKCAMGAATGRYRKSE